ncbi:MAG: YIP1 family protein [Gemmatimonadota bacterium]|nr:YIP1 family protein [Gemmatimonadota bacterium]
MSNSLYPDTLPDEPVAPPDKTASRWEDFMDIFYAPASVFARRATSGFGIPMLVVSLLVGLIFLANMGVMSPIMDAEFSRGAAAAMKKNPQITAEQMAQFRGVGEKISAVAAFIATPVAIFFIGLMVWLVGKLFEAKESFGTALMVASYAYIPKILAAIAAGAIALLSDPASLNGMYRVSVGVGHFIDPDTASPIMLALVGRLDVFTIWVTVLLAIGLSVTGRIPRSKAAMAGVIIWFLGALFPVLNALRAQA